MVRYAQDAQDEVAAFGEAPGLHGSTSLSFPVGENRRFFQLSGQVRLDRNEYDEWIQIERNLADPVDQEINDIGYWSFVSSAPIVSNFLYSEYRHGRPTVKRRILFFEWTEQEGFDGGPGIMAEGPLTLRVYNPSYRDHNSPRHLPDRGDGLGYRIGLEFKKQAPNDSTLPLPLNISYSIPILVERTEQATGSEVIR